MTLRKKVAISSERLETLCHKWRVRELSLFGSVLREDFRPASDVDVLVSFDDEAPWSLLDIIAMRDELADLFGRRVDLIEREALRNPFRRKHILQTKQSIYVRRER